MVNYIDNKKFELLIQQYIIEQEQVKDELFIMFDTLIENIIDGFGFRLDKDEAKQECFLLILKTLKNFKRENGAAFNYFTTIILNNLRLMYTKNKRYNEKIESYKRNVLGIFPVHTSSI